MKTVTGIARKSSEAMNAALTEHINSSLSGDLTICPHVVSLKTPGTTVRGPVRVCNLSARVIDIPDTYTSVKEEEEEGISFVGVGRSPTMCF